MNRFSHSALHAGWLAGAVFVLASLVLGAATPGYEHSQHAISVLGATGMAYASTWNALGVVLPGLLVMVFAAALRAPMQRDGLGPAGRIGLWLLLFSGLAFAGNGVFAYDLARPDARASQLHVALLMITLLAFLPAALLLAVSLRGRSGWRALVVIGTMLALATVASVMLRGGDLIPTLQVNPGYAQRVTLALYFGWLALAAITALRRARRLLG